ncbi:MAG: T9SS type A sorting domain-containing protein [Bacteroidia bacterium]|nr:T9SS type A sorting domain-containing protein [Bacteroidia bacterium]
MKKIFTLLAIINFLPALSNGQSFEWVSNHPSLYSLNPGMVESAVTVVPSGGVVSSRLDSFAVHYGQDAYGKVIIERKDAGGGVLWSYLLYEKAFIKRLTADQNGNVYVCGGFLDNLNCNGNTDQLFNTGIGFNVNLFLLKLDASGNLVWKRNLALTHSETILDATNLDPSGNFWYSLNDFNNSSIFRVDANGDDADSLRQENSLVLSSFDFDPWGNLFIAGATTTGTLTFGNQSFTVPETYMMYLGRYDINRNASWAYFGHDITFQHPEIVSDNLGNAYMAGTVFDSISFGTLHFPAPQWSEEFFLFKIDSAGVFQWGKSNPANLSLPITGRFLPERSKYLDADLAGNVYIGGKSAGVMDWGNGIVLTAGSGQLFENLISIVSFDGSGNSRWGKIFGSDTYSGLHSLATTDVGDVYFSAGLRDSSVFDTIFFPGVSTMNFALGKIARPINTDLVEINQELQSIYPVPSKGIIHFLGNEIQGEIRFYDLTGKLVHSDTHQSNLPYNAAVLKDGFYLMEFVHPRGSEKFRWMKVSE